MDIDIFIHNFIEQYGTISILLIVMLEYANAPIPSEVVLPLIGVFVAKGELSFTSALVLSVIGGLIGSVMNYFIGFYLGQPLFNKLIDKSDKLKKSLDTSMYSIHKYGKLSVMIGRVIPFVRTTISIPAGIIKMNILSFILYSCVGITLWNSILVYLGYIFVENILDISIWMKKYGLFLLFFILSLSILFIIKKYLERKNNT